MIEKKEVFITPYKLNRTLHIHLPNDYYKSNETYPVMYMYDGHNLFFDKDATYGKSWGLETFLNNYDKKMIIVGIECNHEGNKRIEEFCPYNIYDKYVGYIQGTGKIFNKWLVDELKPMIDKTYRTMPLRECTGIAGSSMGGLMALNAVTTYNNIFSKAACLSPALHFCLEDCLQDINNLSSDTHIYMDIGSKEVKDPSKVMKMFDQIKSELDKYQVSFYPRLVVNGKHNEATWEKSNKIYMDYLWK
ncbi:MAG: alpha/beta hydrolase-fold protein [Thomasclavelia sp.]|jgi:predicted alpha/beta superfamily hydrolase|nr:alpha/beta hydrolase-fold protein [Thomasclavelia sp.]